MSGGVVMAIGHLLMAGPAMFPGIAEPVLYTALGDDKTRAASGRALERAAPFLRRQLGSRLRLKRAPELTFTYDDSIAGQDRIEQILNQLRTADHDPDREP